MPHRQHCQARQHSDQMHCEACGLWWDVGDPDPPECKKLDKRTRKVQATIRYEAEQARLAQATAQLPIELPHDLAVDMVRTFQTNKRDGLKGHVEAMQRAYRLLLDRLGV